MSEHVKEIADFSGWAQSELLRANRLINLQVKGSVSNASWCEYPIDPPGWTVEARDAMLREPTRIDDDGFVPLPEGPGLGIELDEERIAAHSEEV